MDYALAAESLVQAILKQHPDCDRMMAETIAKAYEDGTLATHMANEAAPSDEKNSGSITIEQWSEDKSPVSSSSTPP